MYITKSVTPVDIQDGAWWWGYITKASPWSLHASHQVLWCCTLLNGPVALRLRGVTLQSEMDWDLVSKEVGSLMKLFKKWFINWLIDWLILTSCQFFCVIPCLEVNKSPTLYVYVHSFWFGLVSFCLVSSFNGISTTVGYLIPKLFLLWPR